MLTKFQKQCIDELINMHTSGIIKDQEYLITSRSASNTLHFFLGSETNVTTTIPAFEDMFERCLTQLKKLGFSVKHVPQKKANCVITVYVHDGFEHMGCEHWFYGTKVFFKSLLGVKSLAGVHLDTSYFDVDVWMFQDEKVTVVPRYAYYFLKIS